MKSETVTTITLEPSEAAMYLKERIEREHPGLEVTHIDFHTALTYAKPTEYNAPGSYECTKVIVKAVKR